MRVTTKRILDGETKNGRCAVVYRQHIVVQTACNAHTLGIMTKSFTSAQRRQRKRKLGLWKVSSSFFHGDPSVGSY